MTAAYREWTEAIRTGEDTLQFRVLRPADRQRPSSCVTGVATDRSWHGVRVSSILGAAVVRETRQGSRPFPVRFLDQPLRQATWTIRNETRSTPGGQSAREALESRGSELEALCVSGKSTRTTRQEEQRWRRPHRRSEIRSLGGSSWRGRLGRRIRSGGWSPWGNPFRRWGHAGAIQ
jgi:hypothetical protein